MDSNTTALLNIKSIKDLKKTRYDYQQRIANEIKFYCSIERRESGSEKICGTLQFILDEFQRRVALKIGYSVWSYAISEVNRRNFTKFLSLGTGMCNLEVSIARSFTKPYELTCVEFNKDIMDCGLKLAAAQNVKIKPIVQDINYLRLNERYDVVFVHAALHHFVELEHIFKEIKSHLAPGGKFIVYDVTTRNGLLLWPDQKKIIDSMLQILPVKYRHHHGINEIVDTYPEFDFSDTGFECIRSQDILPLLQGYFKTIHLVKGFSFIRRLTGQELGPNFDINDDFDRKLIDFMLLLDQWYVDNDILQPESIFWVGGLD